MGEDLEYDKGRRFFPSLSMRQKLALGLLLYFAGTGSLLIIIQEKAAAKILTDNQDEGGLLVEQDKGETDTITTGVEEENYDENEGEESDEKEQTNQQNLGSYTGGVPIKLWENVYNKDLSFSACIVESDDGGIIIAGYGSYWGCGRPLNIQSISDNGSRQWHVNYYECEEDTYGPAYWVRDIIRTSDNNYVMVGKYQVTKYESTDIFIAKMDEKGRILWEKVYGRALTDEATRVLECVDGFLITGYTQVLGSNYDAYVLKTDLEGKLIWETRYGGSEFDRFSDAVMTGTEDFILAGDTLSYGSGQLDAFIVRIDGQGNKAWENTYGRENIDTVTSIEAADPGYILAGTTIANETRAYDYYIFKIDGQGNQLWEKSLGGLREDQAVDMIPLPSHGYLVLGDTRSIRTGNFDIHLFLIDENGDKKWEQVYGGEYEDRGRSIISLEKSQLAILGTINNRLYIVKLAKQAEPVPESTGQMLLIIITTMMFWPNLSRPLARNMRCK